MRIAAKPTLLSSLPEPPRSLVKPGSTCSARTSRSSKISSRKSRNTTSTRSCWIATNPVDILAYATLKISGFDRRRVIGSGTVLDSARFRYLIGKHKEIDPRSIHGQIIGEHGDSELPVWSLANVAGIDLGFDEAERKEIFEDTKNAAYEIIDAKGSTSYAIALALDRIVASILNNEGSVLNVSTLLNNYNGVSDVFLGAPCVVDRSGVREVLDLPLSEEEQSLFQQSADKLKSEITKLEL